MHHSKTSTEAPYTSVGRASVGRQHGPSKTGACKPILNKHDSQTRPLNQPTAEHKQTSFELSLHHGDGGMESLPQRPNHIQAHLGQDAMMSTTQQSRRAKNHSCSTILKARNYSQNSDIDKNSIVAQGKLGPFLQPVNAVCAAGR